VNNPGHNTSNRPGVRAATYDIAEHQVAEEKLEKWLTETDPNERAVLSIVGFGGVGKTTIATALYRKVRNEFECLASVTVSQNYDQDAVMRSILNQVMPQDTDQKQQGSEQGTPEDKKLVAQIRKKLNRVVPLVRIHRQQGNDGSSDVKAIKIETMDRDQLVNELKKQLTDKRYI
jgi:predicted GTPase